MKSKYTKTKKNDCVICGEPCMRKLCRKCFSKRKYKGRISVLKQFKKKKCK